MDVISKGWLPAGAAHLGGAQRGGAAAPCLPALCFKPSAGLGAQGGEAHPATWLTPTPQGLLLTCVTRESRWRH